MVSNDKPLLTNGLLVHSPILNFALRFIHFFLRRKRAPLPETPKKILISNIAHLGDVVIATTILPPLKQKYPEAQIDFLTSSASLQVVKNHPLISRCITYDHPLISGGKWRTLFHFFTGKYWLWFPLTLDSYDLAIDLYPHFPNSIPLLRSTPACIGYATGGFSKWLTHTIPLSSCYLGVMYHRFLNLTPCPPPSVQRTDAIIIHMGSRDPEKDWEEEKWVALIKKLPIRVVLTGRGKREAPLCERVAKKTGAINLCDQLDWDAFVKKIQSACMLISVDSAAIHIAAISNTPTFAFFSQKTFISFWMPPNATILSTTLSAEEAFKLIKNTFRA